MIFLSHWINGKTPCYGGRQENLVIEPSSRMEEGATSNSLKVHLSNHVGTHMDFPRHFDAQGKTLSDYSAIDLSFQAPKLISMELLPEHMISVEDLKDHVDDQMDFLLLRTGFEKRRGEESYWNNNPGFLPEVGFWLREEFPKVRAIGFDFISLTCFQKRELGREAHRAFLNPFKDKPPILIVEDMKLAHAPHTLRRIHLAPLMIENADGAPVTVLAE